MAYKNLIQEDNNMWHIQMFIKEVHKYVYIYVIVHSKQNKVQFIKKKKISKIMYVQKLGFSRKKKKRVQNLGK